METKSTNVELPVELHRQVKVLAASTDRTIRDIIIEALENWVEENK